MRLLLFVLLLLNLGFFAYHHLLDPADEAAAQIAQLQISPERIQSIGAEAAQAASPSRVLPAAPTAAAAPSGLPPLCVDWGAFSGADVARADAAVAALALPAESVQRVVAEVDGYWVHMQPMKTKAEVDRKVGELRALGITDFHVVQDTGPWRNAVSLGLFKSEEAANGLLAKLRERGVRSAQVTRRENLLKQVSYTLRELNDATAARLPALQRDFPAMEMKRSACAALPPKS